jgi:hypothetical protein
VAETVLFVVVVVVVVVAAVRKGEGWVGELSRSWGS